ncbi:UNVERIFIED_CONTAM: hypothetical protein Slati_1742800 [Sesamum latifolium]|uniref:Uncharacterized protein n=1 Tax=Sesamum latifolium TaxID=2727402 RepID=A0AAW2WVT6_9LAMI
MFDKVLREEVSGSPGGRSAAMPSFRVPRGILASNDFKGKRLVPSALGGGSSKNSRISSSSHPSPQAPPSGSACTASTHPRNVGDSSTKPPRLLLVGSLYNRQSLEKEREGEFSFAFELLKEGVYFWGQTSLIFSVKGGGGQAVVLQRG